jgi:transposase
MQIIERVAGDRARLDTLIRRETNGRQRDRLRMVRLALDGEEKLRIARVLGVAKSTVETWVYRYRDGGIDAVRPIKQPGAAPMLDPTHHDRLRARLEVGPRAADGVCTLRGVDVRRIIDREFSVKMSLDTAYRTLHRLGYSCLSPRPRHEHHDAEAQDEFKRVAPLFSGR